VIADCFCLDSGYDRGQRGWVGLLHCLQTAEVFEKTPRGALAYSGDL
jgi:hypothetical protein